MCAQVPIPCLPASLCLVHFVSIIFRSATPSIWRHLCTSQLLWRGQFVRDLRAICARFCISSQTVVCVYASRSPYIPQRVSSTSLAAAQELPHRVSASPLHATHRTARVVLCENRNLIAAGAPALVPRLPYRGKQSFLGSCLTRGRHRDPQLSFGTSHRVLGVPLFYSQSDPQAMYLGRQNTDVGPLLRVHLPSFLSIHTTQYHPPPSVLLRTSRYPRTTPRSCYLWRKPARFDQCTALSYARCLRAFRFFTLSRCVFRVSCFVYLLPHMSLVCST